VNYTQTYTAEFNSSGIIKALLIARGGAGNHRPDPRFYWIEVLS